MNTRRFDQEHPSKIEHIGSEECYYALINETISGHDGYSEREGGGYTTTHYIDIVLLGNKEQAAAWVIAEEEASRGQFSRPRVYKIVLMKPVNVQRTVSITL